MRQPHDRQIRPFARLTLRRFGMLTSRRFGNIAPATPLPDGRGLGVGHSPLPDGRGWGWVFVTVFVLSSCTGGRYDALLRQADSLLTANPESAWALLSAVDSADIARQRRSTQMHYQLLRAEAQNKLYIDFTTDSVMRQVVQYYDRRGSRNERLKAHYLLGCVYRDLGEAPRTIGCFQDAVDCADTLSSSCDFKTLSCVYSQMADMFTLQLALSDAIDSRNKSIHYSLQIQDTLNALYDMTQMTAEYMMFSRNDSAEAIFMKAKTMYMEHDYQREWSLASLPLAYLYLLPPTRLDEAKIILDLYKTALDEPTPQGKQAPSQRMYNYYQGRYYEAIGKVDSAELYYRKMSHSDLRITDMDAMYHGLLDVYRKKGNVDSIVKYTLLYCQANDSSVVAKDRDLIVQMKANYNYNRLQKEALFQTKKAARTHNWLMFFISLAIILSMLFVFACLYYKRRRRQRMEELARTRQELAEAEAAYDKEKRHIELLEITHKESIRLIYEDMASLRKETEGYRTRYNEAQHRAEGINALYEESIRQHNEEMERVRAKIEALKQKPGVVESIKAAQSFKDTAIVNRILSLAQMSRYELSNVDWETLTREFGTYYPIILSDLHDAQTIKETGIRVCILVIIRLRESAIANFLHISDTSISNYKSDINKELFNDKSARTLFKNLEKRYGLFS